MADYIQELNDKLQAARKRLKQGQEVKSLKAGAPTLFEIIDGEISLVLNRAFGEEPLSHDQYLSAHGEMKGMKRIRNLIDSKEVEADHAAQEVQGITENLENLRGTKSE